MRVKPRVETTGCLLLYEKVNPIINHRGKYSTNMGKTPLTRDEY